MWLSTSTNLFGSDQGRPYRTTMDESIRVCGEAGYRYLDANFCGQCRRGRPVAAMTEDNWAEHAAHWRRIGDEMGVQFKQAHAFFSISGPVTMDTFPGGEFGEEMMRRSVLAAQIMGVEWMVVHPVCVVADGRLDDDAAYRYNLAYFRRWHKFWRAHGIGMAIENMFNGANHPNTWGNIDLLIRLVDELNEPDIGVCLDTGHAWITGYKPADCVRRIGARLRATHIAENHGQGKDEHVAPFMGTIDWAETVRALREINYGHDFSFEVQNLTGCFPKAVQPELIRFSRRLGEYLLSDALMADAQRLAAEG